MKTIKLSNGLETIVDDDSFELLSKYKWGSVGNKGKHLYAARGTRKNGIYFKILMHRLIMGNPQFLFIDHINGNTLDNRKENLRIVDRAKNLQNSKLRADSKFRYKGVGRRKTNGQFFARIQINKNKRVYLGGFDSEEDAAKAYDKAAKEYFGEYAKLNFKECKEEK